jgi:hypothetical protein
MLYKDISFCCIVLVIVITMSIHHIMSKDPLVEGYSVEIEVGLDPEFEKLKKKYNNLKQELIEAEEAIETATQKYNQMAQDAQMVNNEVPVDDISSEIDEEVDEEVIEEDPPPIPPIYNGKDSYMVNTCSVIGKGPPSPENCSGEKWFKKANYDKENGIHTITIPKDGTGSYIIEAAGALGGIIRDAEENDVEISPGRGAIVKGIFYLKEGEKYNIIVGQKGTSPKREGTNPWNGGAGGGGGTFMWLDGSLRPLIVAGGGGGQAVAGHKMKGFGGDGSLKERGTMGPYIKKHYDIPDPTNVQDNFGLKGEGGGDPSKPQKKSKGWNTILTGGVMFGANNNYQSEGGFGGGGSMHAHAGGGGGGYSGGGSKRYGFYKSNTLGGGGGGSYFDYNSYKREDSSTLGYNEGDGYISIQKIKDYYFIEGTNVRCEDGEPKGYSPKTPEECEEGAKVLGFEHKEKAKENGWNKNNCEMKYSKCIWRKEIPALKINPGCGAVSQSVQGLLFNDNCKGKKEYNAEPHEKSFKTICMFRKE